MFRNLVILVAIFGLGWGASFGAGAAWGRRSAGPAAPVVAGPGGQLGTAGAAGMLGQGGASGAAGQAGQARTTTGTVDRLEDRTLYVTGANGQQVKVTLTDQTQITRQAPAAPAYLASGTRVSVVSQGPPAADGALTAATVNVLPEGAQGQPGAGAAPGQARPQRGP
jgi:hypothetical protein